MIPRFRPNLGWSEFAALFRRNRGAVARFEREFAQAFGAVDAVAFPYGRSAQWAFFNAVGLNDAEVIMPAYTCSVVAHAVTLSGNRPRFVDIRLEDYNMDLDLAAAAVNEKTRAIIATHTFGYPQDLDRLEKIVRDAERRYGHKVWLMQDCCHAFGAEWNGRMVGTSGDVAVYAFNISKTMTSIFGGMLTFQDQALADKVRAWRDAQFRSAGWLKGALRRVYLLATYAAFHPAAYRLTWWLQTKTPLLRRLTDTYHLDSEIRFPPDYRDLMLDVEAAVGLEQLKRYPDTVRRRRDNARWYDEHLERRHGWIRPPLVDGATYSHYVVRVPERHATVAEFARRGVHLGELIQYSIPGTSSYSQGAAACPNSLTASRTTVNFPPDGGRAATMQVRRAVAEWLATRLADATYHALDETDLSRRLGHDYLKLFYELALTEEYARTLFRLDADDAVIGCTIVHDYPSFMRAYRSRAARRLIADLLSGRFVANLVMRDGGGLPRSIREKPDYHLGLVFIHVDHRTPANAVALVRLCSDGLASLRERGAKLIWGSTRVENRRAHRLLMGLGFEPTKIINGIQYYELEKPDR